MAAPNPPPVPLPPLNNVINLPAQPQNPPIASDIVASHRYKKDIIVAHGKYKSYVSYVALCSDKVWSNIADHAVDDNVFADALTYQSNLIQARSEG
jgi:hypothetical protein